MIRRLNLCILMNFRIQVNTIKMGLSILNVKVSRVEMSKKVCTIVLEECIYLRQTGPNEMPRLSFIN